MFISKESWNFMQNPDDPDFADKMLVQAYAVLLKAHYKGMEAERKKHIY